LIRVGDVGPGGFVAWQTSIDESADRIRRDWMALGRDPVPGDIGWIANTEEGDRAARALKKQDQ
jgi:hypothetical protein